MFTYLALLFSAKALGWLPPTLAYGIADLVGTLSYYLRPAQRRIVQQNMRQVMGPEADPQKVRAAARQVMRGAARYYADLVRVPHLDVDRFFNDKVVVHGLERLRDAIATKKGVIITSAHYGNPEIVVQSAVSLGIQTYSITEPLQPQRLCDLIHQLRSSQGQVFKPLSLSSMRGAIRWLREGKVVPLLCDRAIQNTGMILPFFGAETRMPVGATELALRTGALLMPMFCRRVKGGHFEVYTELPLEMIVTGNQEEDVRVNTLRLLAVVEKYLREDPGQWFVLEPIWRERDTGKSQPLVRQSGNRGV